MQSHRQKEKARFSERQATRKNPREIRGNTATKRVPDSYLIKKQKKDD
jgi:hypothetical protein